MRARCLELVLIAVVGCGGSARSPADSPPSGAIANEAEPEPPAAVDPNDRVWFEEDEREWIGTLLKELRDTGERKGFPRLVELVAGTEALVARVDRGELTRTQLLETFDRLEEAMTDPVGDAVLVQLEDLREALRRAKRGERKDPFGNR